MTNENKIAAIRAHAESRYDEGWDWIVETKSEQDIAKDLRENHGDVEKTLRIYGAIVEVLEDRSADYSADCW